MPGKGKREVLPQKAKTMTSFAAPKGQTFSFFSSNGSPFTLSRRAASEYVRLFKSYVIKFDYFVIF